MRENESIREIISVFKSLYSIAQIFSKYLLTFDFSYGIKIKRFEDIVLQTPENVKIF